MTEKKWLLLCQRHIKIQQAAESISGQRPVSSLCPSALGPSKVAVGVSPQKAFGCQRQAKRSACATRGWVKPASPDRASTDGSSALRTAGGLWGYPAHFRILSPPTHFGFQAALASAVQRPHAAFVVRAENNSIRIVFAAHGGSQAVTGWLGLPPSVDVP